MDVLNKFCSTVSSTVSQLSGVLPGNPVTREYEVTSHTASAGPGLLWKIYSGYKKSTKQPASVFVFEKKQVVPQDKEIVVETLRRGITQLTKLRHPQILVVQHPLEESRDCLAFATEPVFCSLANVLGRTDNMPPSNEQVTTYKLYDVEIKYGLLQVGEGLAFLHRDAKIIHHNLCPASIIINAQGAWKIFGFDFSVLNASCETTPYWPYVDYQKLGNDLTQPELDYLAPECGLTEKQLPSSDMFSLAVLICALYNNGQPLFTAKDWKSYTNNMVKLKNLSSSQLNYIPEELIELTKMMLNPTPELRADEHDFIKANFFEDVCVKALNYLDSLFQWDNRQKSHFFKGLPQIIEKLPHRVSLFRVIPCLVKEFVNPMMVPFVLPSVFSIAENCSKQEFSAHILPYLKTVMTLQDPIQVLLIFMQKMEFLLKVTPAEEVKSDVLPLLYKALEADAQEIQELCLSILPTSAALIEYPAMKNALLPRIKRLCLSTSYISVRVNCLICLGKLLDHLDKWLVLDEVLPFLPQIPSREPAVLMGILGIYKLVLNNKKMNMSKEIMATKVLPFLMPLSIENSLTLNQFNAIMFVIKDMVNRVEVEHKIKLEQLHDFQQEQKSLENSMPIPMKNQQTTQPLKPDLEDLFGMMPNKYNANPEVINEEVKHNFEGLTFQEKHRIITEGNAARRLQNSPMLTPSTSFQQKAVSQTKDLTGTLLGSSLCMDKNDLRNGKSIDIRLGGVLQSPQSSHQKCFQPPSNISAINQSQHPIGSGGSFKTSVQTGQVNGVIGGAGWGPLNQQQPIYGIGSSGIRGPQQEVWRIGSGGRNSNGGGLQGTSLMTNISIQPHIPMTSGWGGNSTFTHSSNSQSSTKTLSLSEINDLLS